MRFLTGLLFLSFASGASADAASEGLAIAKKNAKANDGYIGESSTMEMILYNAQGAKNSRKMKSRVKETKKDGDKSIVTFLSPADVKGTKLLTWTKKRGDDKQWMYLPAFKRTKRIAARNKSGSFMGSEFAYEDLGSQEVEKYKFKLLSEEKFGGRAVWKMERIPKDKRSGYSKQIMWIDKAYHGPLQIDYYDRKGAKLKTAKFTNYKKFGKHWRVGKIDISNHQTRKRSVISWSKRTLGKSIDDEVFDADELDQ